MFYAHFVLSKKGPLARIWLAAHWDKKLTKANIFETDIVGCVETIKSPKTKLALRTSGHLLVGVVRIYSRKAKYLLADCNDALLRIRLAFRPGTIDLPTDQREAPVDAITLCPKFCDFEAVNDVSVADIESRLINNYHQGRPEDITLHEDTLMSRRFMTFNDDDFGFDELMYKKWVSGYRPDIAALVARFEKVTAGPPQSASSTSLLVVPSTPPARCLSHKDSMADSGFGSPPFDYGGDVDDEGYDEPESMDEVLSPYSSGVRRCLEWNSLFPASLGNDVTSAVTPGPGPPVIVIGDVPVGVGGADGGFPPGAITIDALVHQPPPDAMLFVEPPSITEKPALLRCKSEISEANASGGPVECELFEEPVDDAAAGRNLLFEEAAQSPSHGRTPDQGATVGEEMITDDAAGAGPSAELANDTTLIQSDSNEFALEPIVVVAGDETSRVKSRRKRRLIVDEVKVIASETMKRHMKNTAEIVQVLELAPPRKRLMLLKEIGCTEALLALPGIPLASSRLAQLFSRSLRVYTDDSPRDVTSRIESSAVTAADSMLSEARRDISLDGVGRDSLASVANVTVGANDASHASDVGVSLLNASSESSTMVANDSTAMKTRSRRRRLPSVSEVPAPDPDMTEEQLHVEDISAVVNGAGGGSGEEYVSSSDDQAVSSSSNAAILMEELNEANREEQQDRRNRAQLHAVLRKALLRHTTTRFSDIAPPRKAYRKLVAAQFYAVLALKKQLIIDVDQPEPFADIVIRRGPNFSVADK